MAATSCADIMRDGCAAARGDNTLTAKALLPLSYGLSDLISDHLAADRFAVVRCICKKHNLLLLQRPLPTTRSQTLTTAGQGTGALLLHRCKPMQHACGIIPPHISRVKLSRAYLAHQKITVCCGTATTAVDPPRYVVSQRTTPTGATISTTTSLCCCHS